MENSEIEMTENGECARSSEPFEMFSSAGNGVLMPASVHPHSMAIAEVTEGEADVWVGTGCYHAFAGDVFFLPAGKVCKIFAEKTCAVREILFDSSILDENMAFIDTEILFMFQIRSKNRLTLFSPETVVSPVLKKAMQDSFDELNDKDICYKMPIRANIYRMITALLRYFCSMRNDEERTSYYNILRLRPVLEQINEHFTERIYVDSLAEVLGLSTDHFTRVFREAIGMTPIEYINDLRVNKAMELLMTTSENASEISEKVGFSTPSYFRRIFRQYLDMTPMEYRNGNATV